MTTREIHYKTFSWRTHKKNWQLKRPNVCQFELTFRCGLRCKYCYTDCYNKPDYIKKELKTKEVKFILDKVYKAGVIWLCFTGGDPLIRDDFLDIYSYAKDKGFIITIFTNGYSMTKRVAHYLKERPPFVIEMTLNAVTRKTYEDISQVKDSYDRAMDGLKMITQRKLPLKIKTQVMQDNLEELPKIKEFVENLGLKFRPSSDLHSCLNGDLTPCNLRIPPAEALNLDKRLGLNSKKEEEEDRLSAIGYRRKPETQHRTVKTESQTPHTNLFRCTVGGGDGINLDPYGNMFLCNLIRKPSFNLLKVDIGYAANRLLPLVRGKKFTTDSKCNGCNLRGLCLWCPGRALVETGNEEMPLEYYCELAHLVAEKSLIRS